MTRLTDYITDDNLKNKIKEIQKQIASDEQLQTLQGKSMNLLYDKDDKYKFVRLLNQNKQLISELLGADAVDCFAAAVFDTHFDKLHDIYAKRGIPEKILADTMEDFNLWAKNYYAKHKRVGIGMTDWLVYHMSGVLFRLGRLQYRVDELYKGKPVLEVHIPAMGKLDIDECKASLEQAVRFAAQYFPETRFKSFALHCWLLCDEIKEILPPDSNIIKFADLFTRVSSRRGTHPLIYQFVFGFDKEKSDYAQHEARTTLQKGAHKLIKENRWFTEQTGILPIDGTPVWK
jgi:hypothetical protein